jgi:hypothetical protein
MTPTIPNIGLPADLKPQVRYFEGIDEPCFNADGVIKLIDTTETPEARAIRKAFRRRLAIIQISDPDMEPQKQREKAVIAAFRDAGVNVSTIGPS